MKILAICGNGNAGKDTLFAIIKMLCGVERGTLTLLPEEKIINLSRHQNYYTAEARVFQLRFAEPIKHCIAGFLGCSIDDLSSQEYKNMILPSDNWYTKTGGYLSIRDLHTIIGDALKNAFNEDIFASTIVDLAKQWAESSPESLICITDLRFPNEFAYCKREGIPVIKIVRPNNKLVANHDSELLIDKIDTPYIIRNDGTITDLVYKAADTLYELGFITSKTLQKLK